MIEEEKQRLIKQMTKNLPTLRVKLGVSQSRFCGLIGISKNTIIDIENGRVKMTWAQFLTIFIFFFLNAKSAVLLPPMDMDLSDVTKCLQADGSFDEYDSPERREYF